MRHLALVFGATVLLAASAVGEDRVEKPYFGIQVVDEATGRGVPLVELRTVNDIPFVTDSAGWIAFHEPGLMDREVFFAVQSPGYEFPKDGFGNRGVRLTTTSGRAATIKIKRTNIAERLYRVTGQGIYRDSELLGRATPIKIPALNAGVVGQDSVQAVPYRGSIFWLWGDTSVANYPLGNFQTTSATSPLPGKEFDPSLGVPLKYFTSTSEGKDERLRAMAPFKEPGVVWLFGLLNIADEKGRETIVAHYSRRKGLSEELEHGLVRFDDEAGVFQKVVELDLKERWRFPRGNAFLAEEQGTKYYYFAGAFANIRVRADWASVLNPKQYEALTYVATAKNYRWQRELPPTTQTEERKLIDSGKLVKENALYQLVDVASERPVRDLHHSSIAWNAWRKRWILIGLQQDFASKPSHLGEVWYAEADRPSGPWRKAVKIASHPNYSFYNPRQHTFLEQDGGRVIYFEGTYVKTFSGNPVATPRYDYNQLMYRLNLADERLTAAQ